MGLNKRLFVIHGWIGAQLGVLLFVILFSGTLATLSHEIDWLLNPALRVTPEASKASWGDLYAAARRAYPEARISSMQRPLGSRFAAVVQVDLPIEGEYFAKTRHVYLNPYTAEVQGIDGWFTVQRVLRDFHMMLSMPARVGYYLVGIFGIALLVSVVTALLFFKRWWRAFFQMRIGKGWQVFWSDAHRSVGVWSLWFTLVIALTGIWYLVEIAMLDVGRGLEDVPQDVPVLSAETLARQGPQPRQLPVDTLIAQVSKVYPGFAIDTIYFPEDPAEPIHFTGDADAVLVRPRANQVHLNPYDGSVMALFKGEELPLAYRWVHTADPLHFGDFGGLATKLIWFVFGLLSSALSLTGAYLWLRRAHRDGHKEQVGKAPARAAVDTA